MLELIGLIAILYLAFKFLPDFLMFLAKLFVGLFVFWLFLLVMAWLMPYAMIPMVILL